MSPSQITNELDSTALTVSRSVVSNSLQPHGPHQAPLSMEISRQESWSGESFPSAGDPPNPVTEARSPAFAGRFFIH